MPQERSFVPLQNYIFSGFIKVFEREFGFDEVKITLQDPPQDAFRDVKPQTRWKESFVVIRPSGVNFGQSRSGNTGLPSAVRSQAWTHNKRFTLAQTGEDSTGPFTGLKMGMVAVEFPLQVLYRTTNAEELMRFFTSWGFAKQNERLNFKLEYLGQRLSIESKLGDSLEIPTKNERSQDTGNLLYQGDITTAGWLVNDDERDLHVVPTVKIVEHEIKVVDEFTNSDISFGETNMG